jgi:hypothetical protein
VGAAGVAVVVWAGWVVVVLIVVGWTCVVGLGIPKNLTVVGAKGVAPCIGLFLIQTFILVCSSSLLLSLPLLLVGSGSSTSGRSWLGCVVSTDSWSYLLSGRSKSQIFMSGSPSIGRPSLSPTLNQMLY